MAKIFTPMIVVNALNFCDFSEIVPLLFFCERAVRLAMIKRFKSL